MCSTNNVHTYIAFCHIRHYLSFLGRRSRATYPLAKRNDTRSQHIALIRTNNQLLGVVWHKGQGQPPQRAFPCGDCTPRTWCHKVEPDKPEGLEVLLQKVAVGQQLV